LEFILEAATPDWLAPSSITLRIPTLDHESLDHPMEQHAIVVPILTATKTAIQSLNSRGQWRSASPSHHVKYAFQLGATYGSAKNQTLYGHHSPYHWKKWLVACIKQNATNIRPWYYRVFQWGASLIACSIME